MWPWSGRTCLRKRTHENVHSGVTGLQLGAATVQRQFQNVKVCWLCLQNVKAPSHLSQVLQKSTVPQLLKKFPAFYGTRGLSLLIRTHIKRCNNLSKNTLPPSSLPSYTTQEFNSYRTISTRPFTHAACESHLLNILSCETCVLKMRQKVESTPLPTVNKKIDHLISNGGLKTSLRCTPEINWGGLRFQRSVRLSSITERRTIGIKYATAIYEFRYGRTANALLRRQRGIGSMSGKRC